MSGIDNDQRRPVNILPEARSLANAECLTGTFQASHDGQLQLEQAEDASYLLTGDDVEPDADADADEQCDQPVDDDGEPELKRKKKKTKGRVKISMEFIEHKSRRYTTFSKRKTGLMKKAYELATLTGAQVMLLVASETGHVYTFATRKLQSMITSESGKALIQTCLNSPDSPSPATMAQPTSPAPTSLPAATTTTNPAGSLPAASVFQTAANHTTPQSYLHLPPPQAHSQLSVQGQSGGSTAFSQQNAAAFIAKYDDQQFAYDASAFQSAFAADELEAGDESDTQSDTVGGGGAGISGSSSSIPASRAVEPGALRYRKVAPSAPGQSKQSNRNALLANSSRATVRVAKPNANVSRDTTTSATNSSLNSLQTKFIAVPTFHVADYGNSPQLDSDG